MLDQMPNHLPLMLQEGWTNNQHHLLFYADEMRVGGELNASNSLIITGSSQIYYIHFHYQVNSD